MESRYFVVRSPFDLSVGFTRTEDGAPAMVNRLGDRSPIRTSKLEALLRLAAEAEWQHVDRPIIQLVLPYVFVADEPTCLTVTAPFAHYREEPLPGITFGGRFPIDVWPRPLTWAFEWYDTERPIVVKRGEPLFYCHFETTEPERPVRLVECVYTTELEDYVEHIAGVVNMVDSTFGLFDAATRVRPARLITPKPVDQYQRR